MTLSALQHIIRAAQALAEDRAILVLGSARQVSMIIRSSNLHPAFDARPRW